MDTDTRHQLKQNELAEALGRLRHLDSPGARYTMTGILVILLAVVAWKFWGRYHDRTQAAAWERLASINTALGAASAPDQKNPEARTQALDDLRALIRDSADPVLNSCARMQLARARCDDGLKDPTQRPAAFEDAVELLQPVTTNEKTPPQIAAAGWFALAGAYESLRDFDKAADAYRKLTDEKERYPGSPFVDLAEVRLASLNVLRTPVVFAPGERPPPPTQPATSQPAGVFTPSSGPGPEEPPVEPIEPGQVPPESPPE